MRRYFIFTPWPVEIDLDELVENCAVLNGADVFQARQESGTLWKNFPTAKLALTSNQPAIDCLTWDSYAYVSQRLRDAMALPTSAAQFFDVDMHRSATELQATCYKIMNVCVLEDAIEPSTSHLQMGRLAPDSPEIVMSHGVLRFRDNFAPRFDMFHDRAVRGHLFCTEALALRVLGARCSGVRFFEATTFSFMNGSRNAYLTLDGVKVDS